LVSPLFTNISGRKLTNILEDLLLLFSS